MPEITTSQAQAERPEAKQQKSQGEKLFNRIVYGGLAGVGTFVVTLKAAYALRYGRWKPRFEGSVARLSKHVPEDWARMAVETTALMQGGNLMMLPVLAAEKHKVKIVSGLNVMLGDTTPPEAVEQSPKQTAMSLIEGRALAWGVVFATLLTAVKTLPGTYAKFTDEIATKVYNLAERFKWNKEVGVEMKNAKWYRYGDLAAVDIFATAAAATLLYVGGHFFAKRHEEKKAQQPVGRRRGLGMELDAADTAIAAPADVEAPKHAIAGERAHVGILQQPVAQHLSQ